MHVKQREWLELRLHDYSVEASVLVVRFELCKLVHPRE